jgi:hypothetical protein
VTVLVGVATLVVPDAVSVPSLPPQADNAAVSRSPKISRWAIRTIPRASGVAIQ